MIHTYIIMYSVDSEVMVTTSDPYAPVGYLRLTKLVLEDKQLMVSDVELIGSNLSLPLPQPLAVTVSEKVGMRQHVVCVCVHICVFVLL